MITDYNQAFFFPEKFQKRLNIDTKHFHKRDYNIIKHPLPEPGQRALMRTTTFKDMKNF